MTVCYHYTSQSSAASIITSQTIRESPSGSHGRGVYVTPYGPKNRKIVDARSYEVCFELHVEDSKLRKHDSLRWTHSGAINLREVFYFATATSSGIRFTG
jgi:hypothetical protein